MWIWLDNWISMANDKLMDRYELTDPDLRKIAITFIWFRKYLFSRGLHQILMFLSLELFILSDRYHLMASHFETQMGLPIQLIVLNFILFFSV